MDDLKLYADTGEKLEELIRTVHRFSSDICMDFGLDKCAEISIKKGKKVTSEGIGVEEGMFVDMSEDSAYKYLGIEKNNCIKHKKMREKIKKEYLSRLKKICKSELSPKHKITAINQLAMPKVTYSFGIADWPQGEIDRIDDKTRQILTLHKVTYRNQCMDRIYLPRREGGLGITETNQAYRAAIVSIGQYLKYPENEYIKKVAQHHNEPWPN
ncbi:uncharacterized protein T26G10.4-like [Palaemon carinicauda]|uniref:uncharacterized protein T26G10.4-like n=1 Tax=Palaemon carinicauda TaxID=392227 RepID=UPI0035B6A6D3